MDVAHAGAMHAHTAGTPSLGHRSASSPWLGAPSDDGKKTKPSLSAWALPRKRWVGVLELGGWLQYCLTRWWLLQGKTMKDYILGPGGKLGELAAEVAKRGKRGSSAKPEDVKVKVNKPGSR